MKRCYNCQLKIKYIRKHCKDVKNNIIFKNPEL